MSISGLLFPSREISGSNNGINVPRTPLVRKMRGREDCTRNSFFPLPGSEFLFSGLAAGASSISPQTADPCKLTFEINILIKEGLQSGGHDIASPKETDLPIALRIRRFPDRRTSRLSRIKSVGSQAIQGLRGTRLQARPLLRASDSHPRSTNVDTDVTCVIRAARKGRGNTAC